jgi:hypothetical protein
MSHKRMPVIQSQEIQEGQFCINSELLYSEGDGKMLCRKIQIISKSMHPKIPEDWTTNGR